MSRSWLTDWTPLPLTPCNAQDEFREAILPHIKPLFGMKDPPQAMLTLLDNLPVFQAKCSAAVFREEVLPLIYTALDSDAPPILEKALKVIPNLSETLDVSEKYQGRTSVAALSSRRSLEA